MYHITSQHMVSVYTLVSVDSNVTYVIIKIVKIKINIKYK